MGGVVGGVVLEWDGRCGWVGRGEQWVGWVVWLGGAGWAMGGMGGRVRYCHVWVDADVAQ